MLIAQSIKNEKKPLLAWAAEQIKLNRENPATSRKNELSAWASTQYSFSERTTNNEKHYRPFIVIDKIKKRTF